MCGPISELGDMASFHDVQAELGPIESLAHEIRDLTTALQASLPPEQFRLVWKLRDAVERLALAEEVLHEQHLLDSLIRHLPDCAATIRATRQHIRRADVAADEPV